MRALTRKGPNAARIRARPVTFEFEPKQWVARRGNVRFAMLPVRRGSDSAIVAKSETWVPGPTSAISAFFVEVKCAPWRPVPRKIYAVRWRELVSIALVLGLSLRA
jgi:hypothetical protein